MNTMLKKLNAKKNSKKGFTLMEMLIVVAIIAILVAIAIPVFSAQLTKAEERVVQANTRSASSMAVADDLLTNEGKGATYYYKVDPNHNLIKTTDADDEFEVVVDAGGKVSEVNHTAP